VGKSHFVIVSVAPDSVAGGPLDLFDGEGNSSDIFEQPLRLQPYIFHHPSTEKGAPGFAEQLSRRSKITTTIECN
jgi:hypothetical protein